MEKLRAYLETLDPTARREYAKRAGTSHNYLKKRICIGHISAELAINLDRESGGQVPAESTAPDADWKYIRSTRPQRGSNRSTA